MSLEKIANKTVKKFVRSFPDLEFTDAQREEIVELIQACMRDTVTEAAAVHREVTVRCCASETDLAYRIMQQADVEMSRATQPLQQLR